MSVKDITDIQIVTRSGAIAVRSFGVFTIVGSTNAGVAGSRWKEYSSLDEIVTDGYTDTTAEYKMAQMLLSATIPPSTFAIGQTKTADATLTASLNAIKNEASAFYCFGCTTRTLASQKLASDWAETNEALFLASEARKMFTDGAGTPVADTLAKYVKDNAKKRTAVLYHADSDTLYAEGGFAGAFLTKPAGSYTVKFKDIAGLTVTTLSTSQQAEITALNCNCFVDKGGNGTFRMILEGTTGSTFIDEVVNGDYLVARMNEAILSMFKKNDIVSFDDDGIALVELAIQGVLDSGISLGVVTEHAVDEDGNRTGGYVIYSPLASDIPSSVKESRKYDSLTAFDYWKRVGMHSVKITGYAFY